MRTIRECLVTHPVATHGSGGTVSIYSPVMSLKNCYTSLQESKIVAMGN
jgi:hypothetical protein